ncbi:MAG: hypothetical protein IJQ77_03680 [Synergistaceae bacterium]|nr:hypothetical protein [Synergistaceae bacterium]MBR0250159.1 hypothetical protein [Synergistaceae bacterium]
MIKILGIIPAGFTCYSHKEYSEGRYSKMNSEIISAGLTCKSSADIPGKSINN